MNLESPKVTVQKSAQDLFDILTDVKNFEKLMPADIAKFEVLENESFLFGLKGMPEFKLKLVEKNAPNTIAFKSASDKVPFNLIAKIEALSDSSSAVKLDFEGEFNAMMAMMVKGPITKFLETLVNNMPKL
jgi:ribosome-associated toxin RatA of RatAB toxin-antitoxin module